MELKDRLRVVLVEQKIRQKQLADTIKVTESYVSNMLNGKRINMSESLAMLIQQEYGYSAVWLLTGEGERFISHANSPNLTPAKKKIISEIEGMSDAEIDAVIAFINSLNEVRRSLSPSRGE